MWTYFYSDFVRQHTIWFDLYDAFKILVLIAFACYFSWRMTTKQFPRRRHNFLLLADSYKHWHSRQVPSDVKYSYSTLTFRKKAKFQEMVFVGLQFSLIEYLEGIVITQEDINEAGPILRAHFGREDAFNESMWRFFILAYGGKLPLKIKALPEGSIVRPGTVVLTIENTDGTHEGASLVSFIETFIMHVWYPSAVASLSRQVKKIISANCDLTATLEDTAAYMPFALNDFGFRGCSSVESAAVGGFGHLVNFQGTDTLAAIMFARKYYGADMPGYSVEATQHECMTIRGRDGEHQNAARIIKNCPRDKILSMVSDSYDFWAFVEWLITDFEMLELLTARTAPFVIRPDSGNPPAVAVRLFTLFDKYHLFSVNQRGFKKLPDWLRVIYGDGMTATSINETQQALINSGWCCTNMNFGMGGGLLQKGDPATGMNRDSLDAALKTSAAIYDDTPNIQTIFWPWGSKAIPTSKPEGKWVGVFKDPIDDKGKKSIAGRVKVIKRDGVLETGVMHPNGPESAKLYGENEPDDIHDELQTVFLNGEITRRWTLDQIRARVDEY